MAASGHVPKYNEDLRAPLQTRVSDSPKVKVHRVEWAKVRQGVVRPRSTLCAAAALSGANAPSPLHHTHTYAGDVW